MTLGLSPAAPLTVLAIDPGSHKCGLAVVRFDPPTRFQTLHREIADTAGVADRIAHLADAYPLHQILLGDSTGSKPLQTLLRSLLPETFPLHIVPERHTSERARARYFAENEPLPRRLLYRLGLAAPPRPIDDYAAVLIAEDFLRQSAVGSRQS